MFLRPLTYQRVDLPDALDIATATLDHPDLVPPRDRTHVRDRIAWPDDDLPFYDRGRL
jgi:hypothetical protein